MVAFFSDRAPLTKFFVFLGDGEERENETEDRDYLRGDWIQGE